jgi:nitrite reductase/ring-hydroxylating ferredoxin subunit
MHDIPPPRVAAPAEGEGVSLEFRGHDVLVCRSGGQLFAVSNRCSHAGSRFAGGKICDGIVTCPLHGAKFRLATGECLFRKLNYAPLQTFKVTEIDGHIELELP